MAHLILSIFLLYLLILLYLCKIYIHGYFSPPEMPRNNHKRVINSKQRYLCKKCNYFTVHKIGKKIDDYYVTKALQLYLRAELPRNRTYNRSLMSPSVLGKII
jgi:hypothetical protein